MGPKKGKKAEEAEETPDQLEWKQLKTEADRLHKATKKEEHSPSFELERLPAAAALCARGRGWQR